MSTTDSVPSRSSGHSCHSQNYVESVSVEICTIMTRLGYGEEIRRWRVEKYRGLDRLRNKRSTDVISITAGSKAEGLTGYFESDKDTLYILKHVLCVEAGTNLDTIPDDIDVFRMDTREYPGHCILLQERPATIPSAQIYNSLCHNGYGEVLLSSRLFQDYMYICQDLYMPPLLSRYAEPTGPSRPVVGLDIIYDDIVDAIPCHCPSILQRWAARPRHWPSPVIVQKVVSFGACVTPVGHKGSDNKHIEWRICFNIGETELVNNLNGTQAKVYVILKMILKDLLKPTKKEITSYVLKNIILWQAENTQPTEFYERSLLHWLYDGLRQLRTAIDKKHLCYYMIPERNLMAACGLEDALQRKWVADITDMMDEGPRVILRLEKIRKAIVASPEPMLWFSQKRMEVEMLYLELQNRLTQITNENGDLDLGYLALEFYSCLNVSDVLGRIRQEGNPAIGPIDVLIRLLM
ncbi:uncharacterized protein LOC127850131 isoform X4 [Dreissena polymorpha]|uniref:uncharacterized protein LOC127850131 isoform X4 n=1 Tax=Dreissena polymorpha TaxID=45954 RepID=UPI002264ECF4|nr:uncharacterized protein LOC127850131 isoform X4 [Dreissena polymorpha]